MTDNTVPIEVYENLQKNRGSCKMINDNTRQAQIYKCSECGESWWENVLTKLWVNTITQRCEKCMKKDNTQPMQDYKCNSCGATWGENTPAEFWVSQVVYRTCTGCLHSASDRKPDKPVVWIMRVGTKDDKGFYNICDDDGDNHKMPSGIKPFATLDDWQNIYDMCEVRVFEPTEHAPTTTLEIEITKALDADNKRLRAGLQYIAALAQRKDMHLGHARKGDKKCIACMAYFALAEHGEEISAEEFYTLIDTI